MCFVFIDSTRNAWRLIAKATSVKLSSTHGMRGVNENRAAERVSNRSRQPLQKYILHTTRDTNKQTSCLNLQFCSHHWATEAMAQGNHKLAKSKKSAGAQKKKGGKAVKLKRKGSAKIVDSRVDIATTKAINRKNERIVAAKALNGGANFSLKDIAERGQ